MSIFNKSFTPHPLPLALIVLSVFGIISVINLTTQINQVPRNSRSYAADILPPRIPTGPIDCRLQCDASGNQCTRESADKNNFLQCQADPKYASYCFTRWDTNRDKKITSSDYTRCIQTCGCRITPIPSPTPAAAAYFVFDTPPADGVVTIKLTDPVKIQQARAIVARTSATPHVQGTVVREQVAYNPGWSFHLDVSGFFQVAPEYCDASIPGIESHPEVTAWCPWASRIYAEITPGMPTPTPPPFK